MVYRANIPQSTDILGISARQMQENFSSIAQSWQIDHYSLNEPDSEKQGKHKKFTLPEQGSAPTTAASEVALFAQNDINSDIYYRPESDGTAAKIFVDKFPCLGNLRLEAYVAFSGTDGKILSAPAWEENEEGEQVVGSRLIKSPNVTAVSLPVSVNSRFRIDIDPNNPLSTADYFYTIDEYRTAIQGISGVYRGLSNALYSNTCTTTKLELGAYALNGNGLTTSVDVKALFIQIWTLAS